MHLAKTSIALAAFLVGCAAASVAPRVIPSARAGTNPPRWEYLCLAARPAVGGERQRDLEAFNRAGAEGWELAAAAGPDGQEWCFKRERP